jgi:hypothetical protein
VTREFVMGDSISRLNAALGLILTIGMIAMGIANLNPLAGHYAATATELSTSVPASK